LDFWVCYSVLQDPHGLENALCFNSTALYPSMQHRIEASPELSSSASQPFLGPPVITECIPEGTARHWGFGQQWTGDSSKPHKKQNRGKQDL